MTILQASEKWGVSESSARRAVVDGKIPGVTRVRVNVVQDRWEIPESAVWAGSPPRAPSLLDHQPPSRESLDACMNAIHRVWVGREQRGLSMWQQLVSEPRMRFIRLVRSSPKGAA